MKTRTTFIAVLLCLLSALSYGQRLAEDLRPFDFNDKYYHSNGVISEMLIGRKNGADGESVFDFTNDRRFSSVRITATHPAYDADGTSIFWNYYAGVSKDSFTLDDYGQKAVSLAFAYPLYVFPSTSVKASDRQAALIRTGDRYFEENQLGVAAVIFVEYTELINTTKGQIAMTTLRKRNGSSLDGTPIIRTVKELDLLREQGFVELTQPSQDEPYRTPFAISKVIRFPEQGGITPDAFLKYVKQVDGSPLDAESHFVLMFECHKGSEKCL